MRTSRIFSHPWDGKVMEISLTMEEKFPSLSLFARDDDDDVYIHFYQHISYPHIVVLWQCVHSLAQLALSSNFDNVREENREPCTHTASFYNHF